MKNASHLPAVCWNCNEVAVYYRRDSIDRSDTDSILACPKCRQFEYLTQDGAPRRVYHIVCDETFGMTRISDGIADVAKYAVGKIWEDTGAPHSVDVYEARITDPEMPGLDAFEGSDIAKRLDIRAPVLHMEMGPE